MYTSKRSQVSREVESGCVVGLRSHVPARDFNLLARSFGLAAWAASDCHLAQAHEIKRIVGAHHERVTPTNLAVNPISWPSNKDRDSQCVGTAYQIEA